MRTLSAALRLLDARPARAGVHLGGRLLLVFLEASLVDTALVLPWTPVSPDEFFVAGDAGPREVCIGRRAAAFSEHAVFERRQHVPFRSVVRLKPSTLDKTSRSRQHLSDLPSQRCPTVEVCRSDQPSGQPGNWQKCLASKGLVAHA